ncbi:CPBP family intramembrane glutamic endopeptidase [Ilumatobacter sp.]|uniref:CPBP family intramembrane glutamic endopeptidase n=1 Tax=Ilumatobacter sp. TaxID=1967498 RepID=UPI0037514AB3
MTDPRKPVVRSGIRPSQTLSPIDATSAVVAFLAAWFVAQVLSVIVLSISGETGGTDTPIGVLAVALAATWFAYIAGMWTVSERSGTADPVNDFGISMLPIDAIGFGIGVLAQLVVIRLVYLPLENLWPTVFGDDELKRNAEGLVDRAGGLMTVLLFVLVVLGAPVVEELFYRGLLQRSLLARFNDTFVVVGVAALFALIHFRPVEYPGLFAFGLILGLCAQITGRLGMSITAHIGFNLTGLILVL